MLKSRGDVIGTKSGARMRPSSSISCDVTRLYYQSCCATTPTSHYTDHEPQTLMNTAVLGLGLTGVFRNSGLIVFVTQSD